MRSTPDGLPTLARGRHRRPQDGACAMELVSVLSGERWSDSPACTHPLLARLARQVNDATTDAARHRLAPLAPDLVGLTGPDPLWHLEIALAVSSSALPVAAPWDQDPLAAAVLTCERDLGLAAGLDRGRLRPSSVAALAAAPAAAEWARTFTGTLSARSTELPGGAIVSFAVQAVLTSGARDVDAALLALLRAAVAACRRLARHGTVAPAAQPATASVPGPRIPTRALQPV